MDSPNQPDTFYTFVNHARLTAKNNIERTGRFTSAAFGLAFPDLVPVATIATFSKGGRPVKVMKAGPSTDDPEARNRYIAGTLDHLPFVPNPEYFGFLNPFGAAATNGYQVEFDAEVVRRQFFPLLPSRLSAIYAFGQYETCRQVSTRYNWPLDEVREFRLVRHEHARVTKVNIEIVSLARTAYEGDGFLNPEEVVALWRAYWSGGASGEMDLPFGETRRRLTCDCIWEYLIEGALEVIDQPGTPGKS